MEINVQDMTIQFGGKNEDIYVLAKKLSAKNIAKVAEVLSETNRGLPRIFRTRALRMVLNDFVKIAKELPITTELLHRLNWYSEYSDYQLNKLFTTLANSGEVRFHANELAEKYKISFWILVLVSSENINLSEDTLETLLKLDDTFYPFDEFNKILNNCLYDFDNCIDVVPHSDFSRVLFKSSTVAELREIAAKYEINVPKRLNRAQLLEVIIQRLEEDGKYDEAVATKIKDMKVVSLQRFAKDNDIKASTELRKDAVIDFILKAVENNQSNVKSLPLIDLVILDEERFEMKPEYIRDIDAGFYYEFDEDGEIVSKSDIDDLKSQIEDLKVKQEAERLRLEQLREEAQNAQDTIDQAENISVQDETNDEYAERMEQLEKQIRILSGNTDNVSQAELEEQERRLKELFDQRINEMMDANQEQTEVIEEVTVVEEVFVEEPVEDIIEETTVVEEVIFEESVNEEDEMFFDNNIEEQPVSQIEEDEMFVVNDIDEQPVSQFEEEMFFDNNTEEQPASQIEEDEMFIVGEVEEQPIQESEEMVFFNEEDEITTFNITEETTEQSSIDMDQRESELNKKQEELEKGFEFLRQQAEEEAQRRAEAEAKQQAEFQAIKEQLEQEALKRAELEEKQRQELEALKEQVEQENTNKTNAEDELEALKRAELESIKEQLEQEALKRAELEEKQRQELEALKQQIEDEKNSQFGFGDELESVKLAELNALKEKLEEEAQKRVELEEKQRQELEELKDRLSQEVVVTETTVVETEEVVENPRTYNEEAVFFTGTTEEFVLGEVEEYQQPQQVQTQQEEFTLGETNNFEEEYVITTTTVETEEFVIGGGDDEEDNYNYGTSNVSNQYEDGYMNRDSNQDDYDLSSNNRSRTDEPMLNGKFVSKYSEGFVVHSDDEEIQAPIHEDEEFKTNDQLLIEEQQKLINHQRMLIDQAANEQQYGFGQDDQVQPTNLIQPKEDQMFEDNITAQQREYLEQRRLLEEEQNKLQQMQNVYTEELTVGSGDQTDSVVLTPVLESFAETERAARFALLDKKINALLQVEEEQVIPTFVTNLVERDEEEFRDEEDDEFDIEIRNLMNEINNVETFVDDNDDKTTSILEDSGYQNLTPKQKNAKAQIKKLQKQKAKLLKYKKMKDSKLVKKQKAKTRNRIVATFVIILLLIAVYTLFVIAGIYRAEQGITSPLSFWSFSPNSSFGKINVKIYDILTFKNYDALQSLIGDLYGKIFK